MTNLTMNHQEFNNEREAYKYLQAHPDFTGRITWDVPCRDAYNRPHPCFGECELHRGELTLGKRPAYRPAHTRRNPLRVPNA